MTNIEAESIKFGDRQNIHKHKTQAKIDIQLEVEVGGRPSKSAGCLISSDK